MGKKSPTESAPVDRALITLRVCAQARVRSMRYLAEAPANAEDVALGDVTRYDAELQRAALEFAIDRLLSRCGENPHAVYCVEELRAIAAEVAP